MTRPATTPEPATRWPIARSSRSADSYASGVAHRQHAWSTTTRAGSSSRSRPRASASARHRSRNARRDRSHARRFTTRDAIASATAGAPPEAGSAGTTWRSSPSSSAASCEGRSDGGKKCRCSAARRSSRDASARAETSSRTNATSSQPASRALSARASRNRRRRAEHARTPSAAALAPARSPSAAAMRSSQSARSSSLRASPRDIFATFSRGWHSSASKNVQRERPPRGPRSARAEAPRRRCSSRNRRGP